MSAGWLVIAFLAGAATAVGGVSIALGWGLPADALVFAALALLSVASVVLYGCERTGRV